MHTIKLAAVLASVALTAGTTTLTAGPAEADTATQVSVNLGGYGKLTAPYGTYLGTFATQITTDGTSPVTAGAADLQEKKPGKEWKIVKTDSDVSEAGGGATFGMYGSKAKGNVRYRVHYLGGTDTDTATTYTESFSNTVIVRTRWNLNDSGICAPRCKIYGKLAPKSRHHRVVIKVARSRNGTWHDYKVVRTNSRSHWTAFVKPTRGKGRWYRAVVAGTQHLSKGFSMRVYHVYIQSRSTYGISPR